MRSSELTAIRLVEARGVEPLSHDEFTGRDYMLSPGRFVGYGMTPRLESHRLDCMKLSRPDPRSLRIRPYLLMAFIRRSRCLPVNVADS